MERKHFRNTQVLEMMEKAGGALGKMAKAMKKMKALDLSKLIPKEVHDYIGLNYIGHDYTGHN